MSWIACTYVFGHPEDPQNYRLLKKLNRLPEFTEYTPLNAPSGSVLSPDSAYGKLMSLNSEQLVTLNKEWKKNLVTNFKAPKYVQYIEGSFRMTHIRKLTEEDFVTKGFVVRGRAYVRPNQYSPPSSWPVVIEYIFPTAEAAAITVFNTGDMLELSKIPYCASIVHSSTFSEESEKVLCLTIMPLSFTKYTNAQGKSFKIEPPKFFNLDAPLPIFEQHR